MAWLMCALGLLILLLAGDALVKGAVNLSLRVGIPALIVSLTIVAFGTSAPELLIAVSSVLDKKPDIAMGNVVGSNTANILLVLGIPALISRMHTSEFETRKTYLYMMGASLIFIALAYTGPFGVWQGIVLLTFLAFVLADQVREALSHRRSAKSEELDSDVEGADPDMPWWQIWTFLILGLIGLPLGADLLVENASVIAREYGVSESVIGLTLVAVGTSLPELATTVVAAMRRQADVALGNVIGSNMFNLLAIIGVASFVGPIPVNEQILNFDLWVMLAASLVLLPFVFLGWNLTRRWGIALTAAYAAYIAAVIVQG